MRILERLAASNSVSLLSRVKPYVHSTIARLDRSQLRKIADVLDATAERLSAKYRPFWNTMRFAIAAKTNDTTEYDRALLKIGEATDFEEVLSAYSYIIDKISVAPQESFKNRFAEKVIMHLMRLMPAGSGFNRFNCGDAISLVGQYSVHLTTEKLSEKPLSYESLYLNGACVLFGAMRLRSNWIPRIRIMHSLESVRRS